MTALLRALRLTAAIWLLTVVVVTLPMLGLARLVSPQQAEGSLVEHSGRVVGSRLLGQAFNSERYLKGRPSAVAAASAGKPISGASNLSVANPQLRASVEERSRSWQQQGLSHPAPDLLTSSASGLDPHITLQAALQQAPLVAQARNIPQQQVETTIRRCAEHPLFGRALVRVLTCNLALDDAEP
jgi:K+-transporting ATPase ATPase C chain